MFVVCLLYDRVLVFVGLVLFILSGACYLFVLFVRSVLCLCMFDVCGLFDDVRVFCGVVVCVAFVVVCLSLCGRLYVCVVLCVLFDVLRVCFVCLHDALMCCCVFCLVLLILVVCVFVACFAVLCVVCALCACGVCLSCCL